MDGCDPSSAAHPRQGAVTRVPKNDRDGHPQTHSHDPSAHTPSVEYPASHLGEFVWGLFHPLQNPAPLPGLSGLNWF
jgi:hypothetical protein